MFSMGLPQHGESSTSCQIAVTSDAILVGTSAPHPCTFGRWLHTSLAETGNVASHPEAIHKTLVGVPCGQVSEGDDYLQSIWKRLANSCLLLLNQWVHSFHKLCEEFWRQSDKISVAIYVRIQQLVHQNFILDKQWPLQDQFLTQHCLQGLRALQRAKSR